MPFKLSPDPLPISDFDSNARYAELDFSQRIPCIILIDCLQSNNNVKNQQVKKALQEFHNIVAGNSLFSRAIDICVMSVGAEVQIEQDFVSGIDFQIPTIHASNECNLNAALDMALTKLDARVKTYLEFNSYNLPATVFVISSFNVTDSIFEIATQERIQSYILNDKIVLIPMNLGNIDTTYPERYYPNVSAIVPVLDPLASNFRDVMPSFWAPNHFRAPVHYQPIAL